MLEALCASWEALKCPTQLMPGSAPNVTADKVRCVGLTKAERDNVAISYGPKTTEAPQLQDRKMQEEEITCNRL